MLEKEDKVNSTITSALDDSEKSASLPPFAEGKNSISKLFLDLEDIIDIEEENLKRLEQKYSIKVKNLEILEQAYLIINQFDKAKVYRITPDSSASNNVSPRYTPYKKSAPKVRLSK